MANPNTLVDISTPWRPWDPTSLVAYMGTSYVDLRFVGGGGDKTPIRLLANGDTRLYGELILEKGLIRSYGGFGFTSYSGAGPLASFRQGSGIGTEVLRINTDGSVQSQWGATLKLKGTVPTGDAPQTGVEISSDNNADTGRYVLEVKEPAGTVLTVSGCSDLTDEVTILRGYGINGFQLLAQDSGDSETDFSVTAADINLTGVDINLTATGDTIRFIDSGATTRFQFDLESANATFTADSGHSADLVLDSTASAGGKSWNLRSGNSTGILSLINITDSVTVEIHPDGSIYSPAYVGTDVVTTGPGSSDGQPGAMVVYSVGANHRLYVKVDSSNWKSVVLS